MNKNIQTPFALTLIALTLFVAQVHCKDYYVATNGSDNNPGTISAPWLLSLPLVAT